ncbi:MAG TPA: CotH kinase family protein [Verrucomicrobiota bacterium]|nr:hypothetical protein [Verrucomicrobiales bacterium]HRI11904.1 CotH kinase family protein [Verrucomicrobiota bacterium]
MFCRWLSWCLVVAWCGANDVRAELFISEFMARNVTTLTDNKSAYPDWIELYNPGPDPVALDGWFLTDSATNLTQWRLGAQTLEAGSYLVIFASGKNVASVNAQWHTNFKLASGGGYLALVRPDGRTIVSEFDGYPAQWSDVSYGPAPGTTSGPGVYFESATPRAVNSLGWAERADDVTFSAASGLFTTAFELSLNTTELGAEIHYTIDGTVPSAASPLYSTPIAIDRTMRVRARVIAAGRVPGPVSGAAFTLVGANLRTFSSNLPVFVLNTYGSGISQDARTRGYLTVVKPAAGRTTLPGEVDFHGRATFEARGSSSAGFPKTSFGLELRGEDEADRPASLLGLPDESDWVLYAPYTDKTLIRDVLAYELSNRLGRYAPRTRLIELYWNRNGPLETADYQGVYVLIEKVKGGPDRVDITELEATDYTVPDITGGFILKKDRIDNNDAAFTTSRGQQLGIEWPRARDLGTAQLNAIRSFMNQFESALAGSQYRNPQTGYRAFIDPDAFIDHWWLVEVAKNIDGYRLSTFMFKDRGGKLNMGPIWDYNLSFGNADYNDGWKTNGWYWPFAGGTDYPWFPRLFQDPDFAQRHADRWGSLRTNVLATSNVMAIIDGLTNQLVEAYPRNFQRWPLLLGRYVWPNWFIGATYADEIGFLKRWTTGRLAWIDSTIVAWPKLSPASGYYPQGVTVNLQGTGAIYYTTDGSDPRASGGGIAPSARAYLGPLALTQSARVVARVRSGSKWSPPVSASYAVTIPTLQITELMYHPAPGIGSDAFDNEEFEFVELRNVGPDAVELAGVNFSQAIQFTFPANAGDLLPNESVIVARNTNAFSLRYGDVARVAGQYSGKLDNAGERVVLTGGYGEPIEDFGYQDDWEPMTDGRGYSLTRSGPLGGWKSSAVVNGTPGRDDVPAVDLTTLQVDSTGPGGEMHIRFAAAAGQSYSLQSNTSLADGLWTTLNHVNPPLSSGSVLLTLPDDSSVARVFRIVTPRAP